MNSLDCVKEKFIRVCPISNEQNIFLSIVTSRSCDMSKGKIRELSQEIKGSVLLELVSVQELPSLMDGEDKFISVLNIAVVSTDIRT